MSDGIKREEVIGMVQTNKPPSSQRISLIMNILFTLFFVLVALACILPVMLVISASITDDMALLKDGYTLFPKLESINLRSYELIFERSQAIVSAFMNSIVISLIGTVVATFIMALYAYPLSRANFKYRKGFTWFVLITMLFSGGLVPWYIMYTQVLGLTDTMAVLIIPYTMSAWYVLIMRTFYKTTLPEEILESARIDGAGEFRIFLQVILPICKPVLATVGLWIAVGNWNDWFTTEVFARQNHLATLQHELMKLVASAMGETDTVNLHPDAVGGGGHVMTPIAMRAAITMVATVPILCVYPFLQKYFVKGVHVGSVKG